MTFAQLWPDEEINLGHWRPLCSRHNFVEAVRQVLTAAHLTAKDYARYSLRLGLQPLAGLEDLTIQTLGQ